jgi:hypothetical protein
MHVMEKNNAQGKMWEILEEADRERYVVTCAIDSNVRCNPETIKKFGLCDFHSYTMMQCIAVRLFPKSKQLRYLVQLRNPWGNKEWMGPWSDSSNVWKKYPYVDTQLRTKQKSSISQSGITSQTNGAADDGRFWMLFKDFFQFFYSCTVNYTRDDFYLTRIPEQIPDETWAASRLVVPHDTKMAFLSLFQMN